MKFKLILAAGLVGCAAAWGADLRIGIIGCDTSHVPAFTEILNNPAAKGHISGGKVVAAFKGGSPDIPSSISRVEEYSKTLQEKYGVTNFYFSCDVLSPDYAFRLAQGILDAGLEIYWSTDLRIEAAYPPSAAVFSTGPACGPWLSGWRAVLRRSSVSCTRG